ncbi:DNA maturase B [Magnetospirillum sp. LM-5]|uniref:phage terminase large subunit n=1 Tax=Magnetospirillum sp. LM-5 TaxID=2681466 RepID=UPI00137E7C40|nr:phage terminase large subunit [Magnetospirillum sp. LM-5]CAA7619528.1 DNA maturase B [Magnetospirillum sp. LM-5]
MKPAGFPEFLWIWNNKLGLPTPRHHLRMARWLAAGWRGHRRELLLMAFRNSGKSTIVGLFCAWVLTTQPDLRIMVLAADFALAKKMVRNVKRIVERHPLTQGLKPKRREQWASDQFTVNRPGELRDPSMIAKGIGANITGSRADILICDDVEVPNTCDSAPKRVDLRERLAETDYVLVPGGMQLYVGTPHSFYTIYAAEARPEAGETRPFLDGFSRLEIPLQDDKGRSAWPERFPPDKIAGIRRRTGPNKFDSQMMLKPVNIADGRLDPDRLRLYEAELVYAEGNHLPVLSLDGKRLVSASCWWDPAYGAPGKGDSSVIAALYTDADGGYWLHRVSYLTHDPAQTDIDEATQLCRQVARFARDLFLPAVSLETNGLGRFLPGLLRRELAAQGTPCAVVEMSSHRAKDQRIVDAFDAVLAAGALAAHRSVWATPFITEMREWLPGGKCRDDGLDAVAGCLLAQPVRLGRRPTAGALERRDWRPGGSGLVADTDFTP